MKLVLAQATGLAMLLAFATPADARGGFFPTYHPPACEGGDCRGDDARSGLPCQGFLCTFSSAKSLQAPVTHPETAAPAAAAPVDSSAPAAAPAVEPKPKKRKTAAKRPKGDKPKATADASKTETAPAR